ncbi:secretory carrier-associated membrane protein 2-like isoform X2 [Hippocampus comes]|uniref:secretory carrier-associated membrane protein 2-like isoform X2 n=1 Tax=Hippocampus comes TaxID=109280 RepID=UPI00094EE242|nr:PREDICTED: secretory carrier-associated membrane protein 2-like isoform X2 [Hippocampus comes]
MLSTYGLFIIKSLGNKASNCDWVLSPEQDASVTQATRGASDGIRDYNPFSTELKDRSETTIPISAVSSQPAILQTSVEQSSQASAAAAAGQANLVKQQEELERKAAELERKEQELQNRTPQNTGVKENNWPPLPKFFPVKPCFYQDFEADIPEEYRRICKRMYYLWMFHSVTLFLNVLACLAYFTVDSQYGVDFGLSILWFLLFTPVSFVCWYRPVYRAFRSDSSFSFFFFFFVFFFQVAVYIIQTVGIPKWGNSGWIASISMINTNLAVAVVMMVVAGFFTVNAILAVMLLKMVHYKYRRTGASFTKAQQEFSSGVLTNRTFQSAATTAAQGAFSSN